MTELKPCPFCGGEAETLTAESMHGGYLFGIMCSDCCSRGDVYETEAEAAAAWNTRHEEERSKTNQNGVTAEQVREAIEENSWAEAIMILEFNDSSWQAIADELNATLGAGTCHWEYPQGVNGWVGYIVCSNCQHQFSGVDEREWTCCPVCGARVEGADR